MRNDHRIGIGIGLLFVLLGIGYVWLNRGYGEVSEHGYDFAVALFSAVNQKDKARLGKVAEMVDESRENGRITDREAGWLKGIVDDGLADRWDRAARSVRRLMQDQVREVSFD